MRSFGTRFSDLRHLALVLVMMVGFVCAAHAAPVHYAVILDGPSESPVNASPGTGFAAVNVDLAAHTIWIDLTFSGLTGTTTACHIHAPTAVALTGTAGVATTTPFFAGFPTGVTAAHFTILLDETLASSFNPSYVTANGGTPASAEAALTTAIADGKAYLNVHSSTFGGGEIRGFLVPGQPTANAPSSWGRIKSLYR
jgi:hypothetical protein